MGQIVDRFGHLHFHNEAEVSQNFLLPLLVDFLGYQHTEIQPEHFVPAFDIPQNRERAISSALLPPKARPDYVVSINGSCVFVCDSKAPDESLDDYLEQLLAYCIALKTDLLLTTNGREIRVYNANTLVVRATTIEDLDLSFSELYKLLNREDAAKFTSIERIQTLDLRRSLGKAAETLRGDQRHHVAIALTDFQQYLDALIQNSAVVEIPASIREAFESNLPRFPAENLYSLQEYDTGNFGFRNSKPISYKSLLRASAGVPILLIGESGIGKTSLLQQILLDQVGLCLTYSTDRVPVLIKLGLYSRSQNLFEMIHDVLHSKGTNLSLDQVKTLLRAGRFILLLDAFDEVADSRVSDAERDLQFLIENYAKCKIIITTRLFRLPKITPIRRYIVQPLGPEKIQAFAQMYLKTNHLEFLAELVRRGLTKVASNTLLLTFLILLFKREGSIPPTRGRILEAIVDRVREWDYSKPSRFEKQLSWSIKSELLTQLAFAALISGKSYALDNSVVEKTLSTYLSLLETHRQIPVGLTINQVLDDLAATGFVINTDEGILFWHRAFIEYFAAVELARQFETKADYLRNLINNVAWEDVLPLAVVKVTEPTNLIDKMLALNVFTATRALNEFGSVDSKVYNRVIEALAEKCNSSTRPIRQVALSLLQQIEGEYVNSVFLRLLNSQFIHVQKAALVEIARRKLSDARAIVFARLDWDLPTESIWDGPSGTAVVEALGEFDDPESQLAIIRIWRQRRDMFTTESSRNALMKVAQRNKLNQSAKNELLSFFLEDYEDVVSKTWEISHVLIAVNDKDIAFQLVSILREVKANTEYRFHLIAEILAASQDSEVVQQLIESAKDNSLDAHSRARFAEALSKSDAEIPLDVFRALAQDEKDSVKAYSIRGLGRFSFDQIRDIVLLGVHPPPYEHSMMTMHSFAYVQEAVFEVLAQHDQIELLLEPDNQPEYLYNISSEVLFNAISNKHLYSMAQFIEAMLENLKGGREIVKAAWVLADLGHIDRAQQIIEEIRQHRFTEGWVVHDIVQGIYRLPTTYALSVIDGVLAENKPDEDGNSHFLNGLCIEALEQIGTSEAIKRLARIVLETADDPGTLSSERALRAIEFLAPQDREDWVIQFINDHPQSNILHRALDTLGVIGSEASLPILQQYFEKSPTEHIQAICYTAIQSIYKRAGLLWFNGEEVGSGINLSREIGE